MHLTIQWVQYGAIAVKPAAEEVTAQNQMQFMWANMLDHSKTQMWQHTSD